MSLFLIVLDLQGGKGNPSAEFSYELHTPFLLLLFVFLGLHPWHMEVPRLGVHSELQSPTYTTAAATRDLSHICDLHHSSQQCWILNSEIKPASSWILAGARD